MVRSRRTRGYNLVVLGVIITVMTIAVTIALPAWSGAIRREKEEELIFRGLQMAEGIRVFQRRFGRLPATLDELAKAEPRSLRQEWKDPMTEDGAWAVVTAQEMNAQGGQGGQGAQGGPGGRRGQGAPAGQNAGQGGGEEDGDQGLTPAVGPDGQPVQGPVAGVRSKGRGKAMKTFEGAEDYSAWRFTFDLVQPGSLGRGRAQGGVMGTNIGGRGGPASALAIPNANWIGRPFRQGLTPGGGTPQGGSGPDGNKGNPRQEPPPPADDQDDDQGGDDGGDG